MVEQKHTDDALRLDAIFAALSDGTRRDMLRQLAEGECSVGELAAPFDMSLNAASKHIKYLETAQLVTREVIGRTHVVRLNARPMHAGMEWLRFYEQFWNERLDVLDALLRADSASGAGKRRPKKKAAK